MYHRTTIALFVITAALLTWVLTVERRMDDTITARAKALRFFDLEKGKPPTGIEIEGPDGKIVLRKQKDGPWEMREPVRDRADTEQILELLKTAATLKKLDTISEKEIREEALKPSDLGFGNQDIKLTLSRGDRSLGTIIIGDRIATNGWISIKGEGEWGKVPVFTAFDPIRDLVDQEPDLLRDDEMFDYSLAEIRRLKFVKEDSSLMVKRFPTSESPEWIIGVPLETRGDKREIEERVAAFMNLEILDFVDDLTSEINAAFTDSQRYIEVRERSKKGALRMDIAEIPGEEGGSDLMARVQDRFPVFRISKSDFEAAFTINPNDVRDRRLASFQRDAVRLIRIEAPKKDGGQVVELDRADREGWFVKIDDQRVPANSQGAIDFINALNSERVIRFVDDGVADLEKYGLHEPGFKLTFTSRFVVRDPNDPQAKPVLQDLTQVLGIGFGRYAKFEDKPFVYELDPIFVESISPYAVSWKALDVLRFSPIDVRRITVNYPDSPPLDLIFDLPGAPMRAELNGEEVTQFLRRKEANRFVQTLSNLRVDRWQVDTTVAARTLRRAPLSISVDLELPAAEGTEKVTRRIDLASTNPEENSLAALMRTRLSYGRVDRGKEVFLLNGADVTALAAPLLGSSEQAQPSP
ncbi:MAG: DUF4340 domain-containing protein [Verrucomicrobiota bacterium]